MYSSLFFKEIWEYFNREIFFSMNDYVDVIVLMGCINVLEFDMVFILLTAKFTFQG